MARFSLARIVEELRHLRILAEEGDLPFSLSEVVVRTRELALDRFGDRDGELLGARYLQESAERAKAPEPKASER